MKKKRVILALASLFALASCGQVSSSDQTNDEGASIDSSSFEETKNVDLSKFKLPNIEDYASIGYGNIKTNDKNARRTRKNVKITGDDNKAYLSQYVCSDFTGLLSDTPFTLIGKMKDESIGALTFEDGDEETNVTISGFQNVGDFIIFKLAQENTQENGQYLFETNPCLFCDDEYGDAQHPTTYLLSKKTGKIYYVGSMAAIGMSGRFFHENDVFNESGILLTSDDQNITLIIREENETLNIKKYNGMYVKKCDQYGNLLTDSGFVSSDLKNHKFASFFDGKEYKYVYVAWLNKFFAKCDDGLYSLNENCEFVLAKETFNVLPFVKYYANNEGNYDISFLNFLNLANYEYIFGMPRSYEEGSETIISCKDIYNSRENKGDSDRSFISVSKSWTWAPFAIGWMNNIREARYSLENNYESSKYLSRIDKDYIEKWEYLYDKLLENKCQSATEEEITEMIHQTLISTIIQITGNDYEEGSYQLGQFNDDGNYEVTCKDPLQTIFIGYPNENLGQHYYQYKDTKLLMGDNCLYGPYAIVKSRADVHTIELYYSSLALGTFETKIPVLNIPKAIFRGKNLYAMDDKNVICKFDFTTLSLDNYELIDTGDYSVSDMYVEDGNIVVTGIDENLDQFTGYLDENDQISFEKVDFGGESSYTLYPIN